MRQQTYSQIISFQDDGFPVRQSETTPLHLACSPASNDTDIVKMLLNKGVQIDALDALSRTAMWHAITAGNVETMKILIQCGASIMNPPSGMQTSND